jgi:hypothetical protein
MPVGDGAMAFSLQDFPSFKLKVFDQDALIFYRLKIGQGGLTTRVTIDQRPIMDVNPALAEDIQARLNSADEVQLHYAPESTGSSEVDSFSKIAAIKPFAVIIFVEFQRTPIVGEIGNKEILSAIEQLSNDKDRHHFDEHGYRQLTYPTFNYVMQRSQYSRPGGRPLFFFRRPISSKDGLYNLTGSFIIGAHARVQYTFRTDAVSEEHWVDVDKAVIAFAAEVLTPRDASK